MGSSLKYGDRREEASASSLLDVCGNWFVSDEKWRDFGEIGSRLKAKMAELT